MPPSIGSLLGGMLGVPGNPLSPLVGAFGLAGDATSSAIDGFMLLLWNVAMGFLSVILGLADRISEFSLTPVNAVWPFMLWLSGLVALALFFAQLIAAVFRGGRGLEHTVIGPVQYAIVVVGGLGFISAVLQAVDSVSFAVFWFGLQSTTFEQALHVTGLFDAVGKTVSAIALGVISIVGVFPAAFGFLLEMLFRQAAILVLAATLPITAATLIAEGTTPIFWRGVRWITAAILIKPGIALVIFIGVGIEAGADGLKSALVGLGILWISLFTPFVLFRVLAFVDPATDAGAGFREFARRRGLGSQGMGNPVARWEADQAGHRFPGLSRLWGSNNEEQGDGGGHGGGPGGRGSGGGGGFEDDFDNVNDARFGGGVDPAPVPPGEGGGPVPPSGNDGETISNAAGGAVAGAAEAGAPGAAAGAVTGAAANSDAQSGAAPPPPGSEAPSSAGSSDMPSGPAAPAAAAPDVPPPGGESSGGAATGSGGVEGEEDS